MSNLKYLNLGCGSTFVEGWTNIDFVSNSPHVMAHNLLKGIPFPANSFDFVYHSHVLEHFPKAEAPKFIAECYRVLKPGGTLRLVIPDLEQIALNYIQYLNEALQNVPGADKKYEWTLLEMYDQVVREKTGGEMLDYLVDTSKNNDVFLLSRNGKEAQLIIQNLRKQGPPAPDTRSALRKFLSAIYHFKIGELIRKIVLGKDYENYKISRFRKEGEIHQWMYDRYSIKKMLEGLGFKNAEKKTAFTSNLAEWSNFKLDGENGNIRKPDSLFMEAIK